MTWMTVTTTLLVTTETALPRKAGEQSRRHPVCLHSSPQKHKDYSIFEQLIQLMLRLRHPGAFSSLADPLTTLASVFSFDCTSLIDRHLTSFPEVSTTRRSAGLPLCLKALLLGTVQRYQKLDKTGRLQSVECKKVSDSFIELVMKDKDSINAVSLVHALNCLRALFREARLSPYLTHSVPTLTKFCFAHFSSKEWSIRNSASMLFFALIVKVFGSDHNRVRLDERELRRKVPGFIESIVELITVAPVRDGNSVNGEDEHKGCFQILCVLARIKPHSKQMQTTLLRLFNETGRASGDQGQGEGSEFVEGIGLCQEECKSEELLECRAWTHATAARKLGHHVIASLYLCTS